MHANLCMHILASTCQDGGNPFPVIRLPVVNSVTDSSRHTLLLPALHSQWSRQVYIIHLASLWYKSRHVRMRMSIGYLEPLVLIQTLLLFTCKCKVISMRITCSRRDCIKIRSTPPTSLPLKGQVTNHTTVKWTIGKKGVDDQIEKGKFTFEFGQFTLLFCRERQQNVQNV